MACFAQIWRVVYLTSHCPFLTETLSFPAGCRIDHAASRIALGVFGEPRERQHWPYEFRALVKTKAASCDNLQNLKTTLAPFRLYAIHQRAKLVWNGHNPAHGTSDTTFRRWLRNAGARLSRWTVRDRLSCRSVGETNFYKSNRRPLAAPAAGERSIWRAHIQMRPRSFAQSLFTRSRFGEGYAVEVHFGYSHSHLLFGVVRRVKSFRSPRLKLIRTDECADEAFIRFIGVLWQVFLAIGRNWLLINSDKSLRRLGKLSYLFLWIFKTGNKHFFNNKNGVISIALKMVKNMTYKNKEK